MRSHLRFCLLLILPFVVLPIQACDGQTSDAQEDPSLAPRILHDEAEIEAYVEAFPYEMYTIREVPGIGSFYLDDNPAAVKKHLRRGEPWEAHVIAEFEKYVTPASTVLDIGAHIGSHTLTLARLVGPEGHVYAFEPQKKVFRELVHNLRFNGAANAIPLRFAVSSQPGIVEMDPIRQADGRVKIGSGGDRAEARTIDSFGFTDISLIKIDVEGHELQVLRGSERTIRAYHPVIIVEIFEAHRRRSLPPAERKRVEDTMATLRDYGYRFNALLPGVSHDYIAIYEADQARRGEVK